MTQRYLLKGVALAAALVSLSPAVLACASCGCTLSTDVDSIGISSGQGLRLDLRLDSINQDQLRSGTGTINPVAASQIVNSGNPQEVERYTRNTYLSLGLDYSLNSVWALNLQTPWIERKHETLGTASDGITGGPGGGQYSSDTSNLGDMRVTARYMGLRAAHDVGLTFGLKLPTGSYTLNGTSTDLTAPGPVAIDRGLQPGSGTTDLLLGAFVIGAFNPQWGYFGQIGFQAPLNSRDQYKPGQGVNLNLGLRYFGFEGVAPQVQLNVRHAERDRGANADTVSTGGDLVYLSPGVTVPLGAQSSAFAFVQLPLYQNLNGVQLAPTATFSLGFRYSF